MFAVVASTTDPDHPLAALTVGDRPDPRPADDWTTVRVRAAALNHHDLWSLRGVGLAAEQCPMILGCDASGVDAAGNEGIVHAVIGDTAAGGGDETLDPKRTLLSEKYDGALAEYVAVPKSNLVAKPAQLSFTEAACLPTAYLTAYRMLTTKGRVAAGDAVLVQGAGGGVATAAILLAKALGARVYATSRDPRRRDAAEALGAT
ncbi:MAG: alcohol dehydrogenase catalytic domain-containing protein, partial [Stackebrandtia sp.]